MYPVGISGLHSLGKNQISKGVLQHLVLTGDFTYGTRYVAICGFIFSRTIKQGKNPNNDGKTHF